MKIQNKLVSIKIGNEEKTFTNLILNSYLDLFADSFLDFKDKDLDFCLVNFTKENTIDETSTTMEYDLALEGSFQDIVEELSNSKIINKYTYMDAYLGDQARWSDFEGMPIKELGFAKRDESTGTYKLYAYLNVENYNVVPQNSQPIVISRIDTIDTDMMLWTNNSDIIRAPYHLTMRGLLAYEGLNYIQTVPRLYSVGFGPLPNLMTKEYLAEDLTIQRSGSGEITINNDLEAYYNGNELYPRPDLYPSPILYPRKATEKYLMYKFKMYEISYPEKLGDPVYTDTGFFYIQYKELKKHGVLNLKVKYERK